MCDIWKIRQVRELTESDLAKHVASFVALNVKWVVFSGGEPLLHSALGSLCRLLRRQGIHLTLLTAGLPLERDAEKVCEWVDDIIASIDGPAQVHDRIRGVRGAYRKLEDGVRSIHSIRPDMPIRGRCTVQKLNCRDLRNTIAAALQLPLDSLSFLAADVTSNAFNRPEAWSPERQTGIALNSIEVDALNSEVEALIRDFGDYIASGYLVERPEKLRRIVHHFRAQLGEVKPASPRCNAPWVSAVIEADGTVRPCFFHDPIGNIQDGPLHEVLNSEKALAFRSGLVISENPTCQSCVCSLHLEANIHAEK
jgi:MoaA/NifB/PqqE/SkfB family radical SAM enzyme